MDFNFIPPKPPDITCPTTPGSPAAYLTVNDDSSSSVNFPDDSLVKTKKKRKHSNKRHRPDCPKNTQNDILIPLGQSSQSNTCLLSQEKPGSTSLSFNGNGKNYYSNNDQGPFVVHVQRKIDIDPSNSNNMDTDKIVLNPIIFGKFIQRNSFPGILLGSITRIGRNRVKITFTNHKDANNFVDNGIITDQGYNAFIPSFCITKMGVIRVPTEVSDDDIKNDVLVPNNPTKIIKVRRLNYKTTVNDSNVWKPSQSVVLTFEGQKLPEFIYLYFNKLNVNTYQYPTIQCFSCCRFGHTKNNCRSKPRCFKCGQNHTSDSCDLEESDSICWLCSGNHFATSKKCPEFNRQKNIKTIMSEQAISYMEANKIVPRITKSYADALSSDAPKNYSYKKTMVINTKPKKKVFIKEFDKDFHKSVAKEIYVPSSENGCALIKNDDNSESTLKSILLLLIDLLKKSEPNNVDLILKNITSPNINNGSLSIENSTVELPKHSN